VYEVCSQKTRFLPSHESILDLFICFLHNMEVKIVKSPCYFLIFILIRLSLTSCEQAKSFQEIDRTFKKSNALEQHNFNLQADDRTVDRTNNIQASPNSGKFDRTTNSPEESAIVLGIFGFCLMCYLLVWKFRGREEANKMLRRIRRRVK
jgi:hypothetical protein